MIKGIGIDLVELQSIKEITTNKFIDSILSDEEKILYENLVNDEAKTVFLGGRYAAKEAIFKAIRKNKGSTTYKEFSVLTDDDGAPYLVTNYFDKFFENKIKSHITITHTDHLAIAYVVLEEI